MDTDAGTPRTTSDDLLGDAAAAEPAGIESLERSSLGRNVVHLFASQVATWVLALALSIVEPRFLGPVAIGQLRLALSLWLIAGIFIKMGTSQHLKLTTARDRSQGITMIGPILVLRTIGFVIASVGFVVYLVVSNATAEFAWIVGLFALVTYFGVVTDTASAVFYGLERMSIPASASVVGRVITTCGAITVLLLGGDARSVVAVAAAGHLIVLIIVLRALRQLTTISFGGWRAMSGSIARGGSPFLLAGATLVIYQQIDTVVIAVLVEDEVLGWYGTADTLFSSLLFPITILMGAVFPTFGRLYVEDPDGLVALVKRSFRSLLLMAVPIGLGTVVVAQQFAPLLLGEDFREAGDVLAVFGPVVLLTFGSVLFATVALATERQRFWNVVMLIGVVMTIPLDLILVPWADRTYSNGAIGGALAYLGTETMMVIIGLWKIAPYLLERDSAWRAIRTLVAGGLMFAAAWPLRDEFLLLPVALGAVVYVVALLALRVLTDVERKLIGTNLAKVGLNTPWARIDDSELTQ